LNPIGFFFAVNFWGKRQPNFT